MVAMATAEEEVCKPNPGPQTEYFRTNADICIYGGGAGGGKSWSIIADPVRYAHIPGFRGAIFRRTYPQLMGQGGLWDECQELYRSLGASMRESPKIEAEFPSGASIEFCNLQHEKDKLNHQGLQYAYIAFDELTHFTEGQFWYLVGRLRSTCGVKPYFRATCNPEPCWVADLLEWWIDQETGFAIPERSGIVRWLFRDENGKLHWGDTQEDLVRQFSDVPDVAKKILSVTFILAMLKDNPQLLSKDPGYEARLWLLPKIERERLLKGNWKIREGTLIEPGWIKRYTTNAVELLFSFQGGSYKVLQEKTTRFAVVDTAGTSKERLEVERGKQPSWSICEVWDYVPSLTFLSEGRKVTLTELLFLRYVWRDRVDWTKLIAGVEGTLDAWNVPKVYIENAHHGAALFAEIRVSAKELIGPVIPGMGDHGEHAKLERAIAAKMLQRFEHGKIFVPHPDQCDEEWLKRYIAEHLAWTGHPHEMADQIDGTSYASYISQRNTTKWGGVIPQTPPGRN